MWFFVLQFFNFGVFKLRLYVFEKVYGEKSLYKEKKRKKRPSPTTHQYYRYDLFGTRAPYIHFRGLQTQG